jgi:hypothetical protein
VTIVEQTPPGIWMSRIWMSQDLDVRARLIEPDVLDDPSPVRRLTPSLLAFDRIGVAVDRR